MKRLELLQQQSANVGLLEEERKQLRDSLLSYMEKTPVHVSDEVALPMRSPFFSKWLVVAVVAGLIVASSGVSFAAQRALPGDALYPVKVGINEKVLGYMAFSHTGKAEVEANLAAKRLEEAETLQASAKLDDKTKEELQTNFNTHVTRFESRIEKIKKIDAAAAVKIDSKFKNSMEAHATILPTMSVKGVANSSHGAEASSSITSSTTSSTFTHIITPTSVTASTSSQSINTSVNITTDKPKKSESESQATVNVNINNKPGEVDLHIKKNSNVLQ